MIKAIIFDLDGTLVNSLDDLADSCNLALEKFSYPVHPTEKYKTFVGNGAANLIKRIIPQNCDESVFNAVKREYDEIYHVNCLNKTAPYPTVDMLFEYIKSNDIKTAVVSNKPDDFTKRITNHLFGGNNKIDVIFGQRENVPKKPSPEGVLLALNELKVSKSEAIYVGDSDVDVKTAKNAGLISIGAAWGFREKKELISAGANYIAEQPKDIIDIIKKM